MDAHITAEKRQNLGLLTLQRPQALNALSHGMIRTISAQLENWAQDPGIAVVAIRGAGPRGFCAGGDIRAVRQSLLEGGQEGRALLRDEYRMNEQIGSYPKPYVALVHGICMGGGAGVSVHGRSRLADASLAFAMPETGLGFIPDVGASHFLSRLPDYLGHYLGLTGATIGVEDACDAGLMTQAVGAEDFAAVIAALAKGERVDQAIAPFVRKPRPGRLRPHRRRIASIFSASSLEAVFERLERDGSDFAQETAAILRSRSPTSLKLAFRQLRDAQGRSLKDCLAMDYRLAVRLLPTHDFGEGVRAALVDKDRKPRWQPRALADVADLDGFFTSLGEDELFAI